MPTFSVPGIPTQLAAAIGIVLAWFDPNGRIPHGTAQAVIIAGLGFVIAIVHAVQAYHRANVTVAPAPVHPLSTVSTTAPPAAAPIGS